MKTWKNLFKHLTSFQNLLAAFERAAYGKRGKAGVGLFEYHLEDNLVRLQEELCSKTYRPGGYRAFPIFDPKPRLISAAPFRDRIVHHALCNVIEPLFDQTFIYDSYANRKDKGTHAAIRRAHSFMRNSLFVLKCDIKKYFASIDHLILKREIRRTIADEEILQLIDIIIDCSNEQEYVNDLFPGDDLITPLERRKGLPLGNLTSQFFANLFLTRLDHFIKEKLRIRFYLRYVDDFLLASNDVAFLKSAQHQIAHFLLQFRLNLHPRKCHIFRCSKGVPFLGQVIFPEYRLLRSENVRRFCRRLAEIEKNAAREPDALMSFAGSIAGWRGHACQADTWRLRTALQSRFAHLGYSLVD